MRYLKNYTNKYLSSYWMPFFFTIVPKIIRTKKMNARCLFRRMASNNNRTTSKLVIIFPDYKVFFFFFIYRVLQMWHTRIQAESHCIHDDLVNYWFLLVDLCIFCLSFFLFSLFERDRDLCIHCNLLLILCRYRFEYARDMVIAMPAVSSSRL